MTETPTFPELKDEYSSLWASMAIRRDELAEVDSIVARIVGHKENYRTVERLTTVPWFAIAIIHSLEASGDFSRHLHNGDPLTGRTVHVPAGRPASGNPPFTWEQSAADAMEYDGLTQVTDWSTEHLAFLFENYNGWGYRMYHPHVKSPYLWSYSNHYISGKYVGDGQWSPSAVSRQCGAMVLLKRLEEVGEIAAISVADARDIGNAAAGVAANGWPLEWRYAYSRHPRDFNQIINDPGRGPWNRTQPDGTEHAGHTDAYEQIVPINEQIAWRHAFSDEIERDSGDVLLEMMEFAIRWRKANGLPTSAFTNANPAPGALTATTQPEGEPATKRAARTATKRPAKAAKKQAAEPAAKRVVNDVTRRSARKRSQG